MWPKSVFSTTTSLSASRAVTCHHRRERSAIDHVERAARLDDRPCPRRPCVRAPRTWSGHEVGEIAEAAEVHPEHRDVLGGGQAHHAQEGAVAAHADRHVVPAKSTSASSTSVPASLDPVGPAEAQDAGDVAPLGRARSAVSVASASASGRSGWTRKVTVAIGASRLSRPERPAGGTVRPPPTRRRRTGRRPPPRPRRPADALAGVQQELDVAGRSRSGGRPSLP